MKTTERMMRIAMIAGVLAGSAAGAMAGSGNNGQKGSSPCMAVVVGSREKLGRGNSQNEQEFGGSQQGANGVRTFEATKVLDLDFAIVFSPQTLAQYGNSHWVEFRVLGPKGNLYESLAIPFTADGNRTGERHRVPGYPELIPVQVLEPITIGQGSGMIAKVRLPVAGTPIVSNSLYGKWRAVAYIDGEAVACSLPAEFTITP